MTYMGPFASANVSSIDSLMAGMTQEGSENYDSFFSDTIREHLFSDGNMTQGMDLIALNIQRGREHGIPGTSWHGSACCSFHMSDKFKTNHI